MTFNFNERSITTCQYVAGQFRFNDKRWLPTCYDCLLVPCWHIQ